ncbi:serine/threonine-protein kinase HSL1-like [Chrysoperla carnea]|uniref:serine/threonine-protein kinase HSL1-like n=1 Tax=Chrysoperla carnea TaxID=189513 RepID=UPI001D072761|nr:serine/threonine-protein kinase HSL1-like [Chrysoperla carnea]
MSENGFLETVSSEYDDNEQKMVLLIETLTGTAFEMIVSPLDSILSIKNKIHHDEGIPINQQHLLLGDKELNNNTYLKEIGITKGCTLKLVLGMRGGPISTRRASSRSEHLIWREIKDFVETTRDDMMAKVPAGCKITFLIYREGDTINLLKVVENNDGSYSSLSDLRKSGRSRINVRTDTDSQQSHTTMDYKQKTFNKMAELRRKMEELNIKKYKKLHKNGNNSSVDSNFIPPSTTTSSQDQEQTTNDSILDSNTLIKSKVDLKPVTKMKRYTEKGNKSSGKSKVKQWLNSDYYDDSSAFVSRKSSKHSITSQTYEDGTTAGAGATGSGATGQLKGNFYVNKTYKLHNVYSDSSDDDNNDLMNNYHSKKYQLKSSESIKRILMPSSRKDEASASHNHYAPDDDDDDDIDVLDEDDDETDDLNSAFIDRNNSNISIGDDETSNDLFNEYYPKLTRTELRQTLGSHRKIDDNTNEGDLSISDRNCTTTTVHETSSIAILEEDSETNVVNDESEFNPPPGPISVPSPDANTFTISQIPREPTRVSTTSGTNSARNRIRVARFILKNDQRPKTSPDKLSREFCEFLNLNSTSSTKCYETEEASTKGSKLRFKRTKYISSSSSKLDKINNNLKSLSTSNTTVCSWPRVSSTNKTSCRIGGGGLTCCYDGHHVSNRFKLTKFENVLSNQNILSSHQSTTTLSGIQNKGFLENIESNNTPPTSNSSNKEDDLAVKKESTEIVTLPPIKQKKSNRVRCKKCSKKLNIATIHTCRCGDHFCSQHRYSEVHGCKYDYKTEGRKVIEQANPLIRAPKLPKI